MTSPSLLTGNIIKTCSELYSYPGFGGYGWIEAETQVTGVVRLRVEDSGFSVPRLQLPKPQKYAK